MRSYNYFFVTLLAFFLISSCTSNTNKQLAISKDTVVKQNSKTDTTAAEQAVDSTSNDWLLNPGVAAGKTTIGSDATAVYERLGKADAGDAAMMKAVAIWYTGHDPKAHSLTVYTVRDTATPPIARIKLIRVTAPKFKTSDGIGPSSSLSQIQQIIKVSKTENYTHEGQQYAVYDSPLGIAFEIDDNQKCTGVI
ncbi:MAG: hypothetical protein EOO88_58060, partial [Pedobacter sp.]